MVGPRSVLCIKGHTMPTYFSSSSNEDAMILQKEADAKDPPTTIFIDEPKP